MTIKTTTLRQRARETVARTDAETPIHVELAAAAALEGWTRDQVINTLISRIKRDRRYLAYHKACNRHTSYDDQVQLDMRVLALAATLLEDAARLPQPRAQSQAATQSTAAAPVVPAVPGLPPLPPTPASPVAPETAGRYRQNEKISTASARTRPGASSVAKRYQSELNAKSGRRHDAVNGMFGRTS